MESIAESLRRFAPQVTTLIDGAFTAERTCEVIRKYDINNLAGTDLLVVSSALIDLPPNRVDTLEEWLAALKAHSDYAKMTTQGLGVDRHLFGLMIAANENMMPPPAIFNEPAYIRSTRHRLSTSQVRKKERKQLHVLSLHG